MRTILSAIGVVVALASLYLAWRAYRGRSVSYEKRSSRLLNKNLRYRRPVMLMDGLLVDDPHIAEVSIRNEGNVPIVATDFVRPISISVQEGCSIISVEALSNNKELDYEVILDGSGISIPPTLLNPSEELFVRLVVSGKPTISLACRITGVTKMSTPHAITRSMNLVAFAAFGFTTAGVLAINAATLGLTDYFTSDSASALMTAGMVFFLVCMQSRVVRLFNSGRVRRGNQSI